jgi:hypothetical protein
MSVTVRTAAAPLARIGVGLEQLRHDIDALVEVMAGQPQARPQLVEIHHRVRLLGQQLNAALRSPDEPFPPEEQQ